MTRFEVLVLRSLIVLLSYVVGYEKKVAAVNLVENIQDELNKGD